MSEKELTKEELDQVAGGLRSAAAGRTLQQAGTFEVKSPLSVSAEELEEDPVGIKK